MTGFNCSTELDTGKEGSHFFFNLVENYSSPHTPEQPTIHSLTISALKFLIFLEFVATPKASTARQGVLSLTFTPKSEEPRVLAVCDCFASCCHWGTLLTVRPAGSSRGVDDGPVTCCWGWEQLEDPPPENRPQWRDGCVGTKLLVFGSGIRQSSSWRWWLLQERVIRNDWGVIPCRP